MHKLFSASNPPTQKPQTHPPTNPQTHKPTTRRPPPPVGVGPTFSKGLTLMQVVRDNAGPAQLPLGACLCVTGTGKPAHAFPTPPRWTLDWASRRSAQRRPRGRHPGTWSCRLNARRGWGDYQPLPNDQSAAVSGQPTTVGVPHCPRHRSLNKPSLPSLFGGIQPNAQQQQAWEEQGVGCSATS